MLPGEAAIGGATDETFIVIGDGEARGGPGDDVYYTASDGRVIEAPGGGLDIWILTAENVQTVSVQPTIENFYLAYRTLSPPVIGNDADNRIRGGQYVPDRLIGGAGNDTLIGLGRDDSLDGGIGHDVAEYRYARNAYVIDGKITPAGTIKGFTVVVDTVTGWSRDGRDTLESIEGLHFEDVSFNVDHRYHATGIDLSGIHRVVGTAETHAEIDEIAQQLAPLFQTISIVERFPFAPTLSLSIDPESIAEDGCTATGTVTRTGDLIGDVVVSLLSDDTGEATVPASVTIPGGQATATFAVTAVDDGDLDGDQSVTVTASASGFTDATDTVTIKDDEETSGEVSITQAVSIDGNQRLNDPIDTVQGGADNDIEVGGNFVGGFLFKDIAIPDGATIAAASIDFVSQRAQGGSANHVIKLFDEGDVPGLSGSDVLNDPGFDSLGPVPFVFAGLADNQTVTTADLSGLVQGLLCADGAQPDGTYDLLFAVEGDAVRRFEPEEFGGSAILSITYGDNLV